MTIVLPPGSCRVDNGIMFIFSKTDSSCKKGGVYAHESLKALMSARLFESMFLLTF